MTNEYKGLLEQALNWSTSYIEISQESCDRKEWIYYELQTCHVG